MQQPEAGNGLHQLKEMLWNVHWSTKDVAGIAQEIDQWLSSKGISEQDKPTWDVILNWAQALQDWFSRTGRFATKRDNKQQLPSKERGRP